MATRYAPSIFDEKPERRSEAALKKCMKMPTVGCRIKIFMGMGAGVFNGISEKMMFDMITNLSRGEYNKTSTVHRLYDQNDAFRDVTAPQLFQETISSAHLEKGSAENLETLEKFKRLEDMQIKLRADSNQNEGIKKLRAYIGSVVGTWGGKDEDYTQKFLNFVARTDKYALYGQEKAEALAKEFANGGKPSQKDEDLAWRLVGQVETRGSIHFYSFASGFADIVSKGSATFVDQHLGAIRRVIDLLEYPEEAKGVVGKTFGRYAELVDVDHAPAPASKTPAFGLT